MSAVRVGIGGLVRRWQDHDRTGVNASYVRSVVAAGGVPLVLSPLGGAAFAAAAVSAIDALLLTGGDDLDPAWYGAARSPHVTTIDRERDLFELALYGAARQRGIPVLAICRGLQLVNVARGGSLVQDLPSERPGAVDHNLGQARDGRTHAVTLTPGSRTAALLGTTTLDVNSFHHQAVATLGSGLVASGTAADGVVEALEGAPDEPWLVAVQWHPEEMWADAAAPERGLFAGLVAAATR